MERLPLGCEAPEAVRFVFERVALRDSPLVVVTSRSAAHARAVTVIPERLPMADRCAELRRRSVAAIREAATTAGLIALTYEDVASRAEAAGGVDSAESHRDRAAWARRRAAEERREAQRMWAQAAALESTET